MMWGKYGKGMCKARIVKGRDIAKGACSAGGSAVAPALSLAWGGGRSQSHWLKQLGVPYPSGDGARAASKMGEGMGEQALKREKWQEWRNWKGRWQGAGMGWSKW